MSEPCLRCGAGRVSCAHREYAPEVPNVDLGERLKSAKHPSAMGTKYGHGKGRKKP